MLPWLLKKWFGEFGLDVPKSGFTSTSHPHLRCHCDSWTTLGPSAQQIPNVPLSDYAACGAEAGDEGQRWVCFVLSSKPTRKSTGSSHGVGGAAEFL